MKYHIGRMVEELRKKYTYLLIVVLFSLASCGQTVESEVYKPPKGSTFSQPESPKDLEPPERERKWYYSLDEALKSPDSVRFLSLRERGFKQFPREILSLSNLEDLDIAMNEFTSLPDDIDRLTKLKSLSCSYGFLTHLPNTIGNLKNLERLWLLKNNLKTLPEEIGSLNKLRYLNLVQNPIETIPETFFQLKNLKRLSFQNPDYDLVFTADKRVEIQERLPNCKIYFGRDFND